MRFGSQLTVPGLLLLLCGGCASVPYREGVSFEDPRLPAEPVWEVQIVEGRPNRVLDASDWIWPGSWLGKLVLWDRRVDNHRIGEETKAILERYIAANELHHVKVRLNQYHPRGEFRRIRQNKSMGAGWRYTVGMISWLQYTLLPGRILGGDHYNPYSNTIHLYSDIPAIAVHEGGHAKDFAERKRKGTYAFIYVIPFVNLHHEALASNDALGYLRAHESPELQREGYRLMHPAYGTYLGANTGLLFPDYALPIYAGAVIGGHITGRFTAAGIEAPSREAPSEGEQ
jgi:hypothetical protein